MGRVHLEALRRVEGVDVAAIASRDLESARKLGAGFGIAGAYDDYTKLLADRTIDAVHICTPNATHYPIAKQALLSSKHVLCEKPLSTSVKDAQELVSIAAEKGLRNCVCHNLRYYPMVQQMRRMVQEGDLGRILVVQGTYSQDWLLYDTDWNWRADAGLGGSLRAMADIGSHWFDMAEHVTGLRVESLCADLQTVHPIRKRPKHNVETFAGKVATAQEVDEVKVDSDDFGAVIFRMPGSTRGSMTASQVSAGRKNRLSIEVYGTKSGAAWDQERPDELWLGNRNTPNGLMIKDPSLMKDSARNYADLPGGHSEGYDDTFKQVFRRFYGSILNQKASLEYPTLSDGLRQMQILDAVQTSHEKRGWVEIPN